MQNNIEFNTLQKVIQISLKLKSIFINEITHFNKKYINITILMNKRINILITFNEAGYIN